MVPADQTSLRTDMLLCVPSRAPLMQIFMCLDFPRCSHGCVLARARFLVQKEQKSLRLMEEILHQLKDPGICPSRSQI